MSEVFRLDTRQVDAKLAEIGRRAPVIIVQTLNRTGSKVRTFMKREVSRDIGMPAGVVDKQMSVRNASAGDPRFILSVKRERVRLIDLGAQGPEPSRGRGRGVRYRLGGGTKRIPDAFIATMPSGHRGVFRRVVERARKRVPPNWSALPIRELFGPSVGNVFRKHIGKARVLAQEELVKELRRRLFGSGGGGT